MLHTRRHACRNPCDIGVDDGIGQPTRPRHHWHTAISEAVELGEAAGFEATGNEDGIAAALHQMRQRLVIADAHADAARMAFGGVAKPCLQCRIAGTQHRQPGAETDEMIRHVEQQVHALLPCQTTDDDEQRPSASLQPERRLGCAFVDTAFAYRPGREIARQIGVAGRIPYRRIDAVDDAGHHALPRAH